MSSTEFIVEADNDGTGLAPTQCQDGRTCTMAFRSQICLRIVTSTIRGRNGRLKVWVNSGGGYVVERNGYWAGGSKVLDKCYNDVLGVKIQGPTNNSWGGDIYISSDGGQSYAPMHCSTCSGTTTVATSIYVDGNADQSHFGTTQCVNGNICLLPLPLVCKYSIFISLVSISSR